MASITTTDVGSATVSPPAYLPARFGIGVQQTSDRVWRVTRADGVRIGHIEKMATEGGAQFAARRLLPRDLRHLQLGTFWSIDDAIDCFRLG